MEATHQGTSTFDAPNSPQEARERLSSLRDHVNHIQSKLSGRETPSQGTQTMTAPRWYDVTLQALMEGKQELEYLQSWLREHQVKKTAETLEVDLDNPEDVIRVANNLFQTLQNENRMELSEFESRMVNLVRYYTHENS